MKKPVCVWPDDLEDADLQYELHWQTIYRLHWRLDFSRVLLTRACSVFRFRQKTHLSMILRVPFSCHSPMSPVCNQPSPSTASRVLSGSLNTTFWVIVSLESISLFVFDNKCHLIRPMKIGSQLEFEIIFRKGHDWNWNGLQTKLKLNWHANGGITN